MRALTCLHWCERLLRTYLKPYHERFGEGIEQTFNDLSRERTVEANGLFGCAPLMFVETSVGIIRENMTMKTKHIVRIALATAFILLLPLVAMQFTDNVVWNLADFVVAGALLLGTGLMYELVARKGGNIAYRAAVGVALAGALLLVWANLAVGIIGNEDNPANLMYFGVLAVGLIGAAMARLEQRGMARALFATALAQALVPVIALIIWKPSVTSDASGWGSAGVSGVFGLNAFFVMLFVGSALLFRRAVRVHNGPLVD